MKKLILCLAFVSISSFAAAQKQVTFNGKTNVMDVSKWKGIKSVRLSNDLIEYRLMNLVISSTLKKIVVNEYESDYQFNDGILAVCNTDIGRYAFYDEEGNQLPGGFKWSKPLSMSREFAFGAGHCIVFEHVRTESGFHKYLCYILDKNGKTKRLPACDNVSDVWPFNNGGIAAVETSGIYVSFFNTNGEQVLKGIHAEEHECPIGDFIDGWARVYAGNGGREKGYTFVNKLGKTIGKYYKRAQEFSEGMAAVYMETENGNRWGFIDTSGKMVIEPRFSNEPTPFSCGYTVVQKQNGNMVYINKQGKVCGEEAKWLTTFVGGKAFGSSGHDEEGHRRAWTVDTAMQHKDIPQKTYQWVEVGGVENLAKFPIRTVFGGRYIRRHDGEFSGYREGSLIDVETCREYTMNCFGHGFNPCVFDHATPRRIHVAWTDGDKRKRDGFLNEKGELCLEFVSEEF